MVTTDTHIRVSCQNKTPSAPSSSEKRDASAMSNQSKGTQANQVIRKSTRRAQNRKPPKDRDLFKNQILDLPKLLKKISSKQFSLTQENQSQEKSSQSQKESRNDKRSALKRKHAELSQQEETEMVEIIQIFKKLKIEDPAEHLRLKKAEETKKKVEAVLNNYEFLKSDSDPEFLRKELPVMLNKIGPFLHGTTLPEKIKLNLLYCLDVSFEEEELNLLSMRMNTTNKYAHVFAPVNLLASMVVDHIKQCEDSSEEICSNYPWD